MTKSPILMLPALLAVGLTLSANGRPAASAIRADVVLENGTPAGTARIRQRHGHTVLELNLRGIAPGIHGAHIHAVGQCTTAGAAFSGAGPHLNPHGRQHGANNPQGKHLGDLPNVTANARGRVRARIELTGDRAGLEAALFDADGSAIVIHAAPDDMVTDPSGSSGARIACGVFARI